MSDALHLPPPPAPPSWGQRLDAIAVAVGVERTAVLVVLAALVAAAIGAIGLVATRSLSGGSRTPAELSLPRASTRAEGATGVERSGPVVVAAAGAVLHPGVYRVAAGARVIDVLQAAGGPTADADIDRVNLAAKVADGERVYVPRKGEPSDPLAATSGGAGASAAAAPTIIDLNTATAAQLEALPGIGPATAQAIIDYRTQHRRFHSVNELLEVRGIGEAKLAQLRPHLRVS